MARFKDRAAQLEYELGGTAGIDPIYDARRSGMILALRELIEVEWREDEG